MIGMNLLHAKSGVAGTVDAVSVDPDGKSMCRIEDHWFFVDECTASNQS